MSIESLRLVATLAGGTVALPTRLYPDTWPRIGVRIEQYARQLWAWCLSATRRDAALMLSGIGLPAAKGAVTVASLRPPWQWQEPTLVLPGGSDDRLFAALGVDASPPPILLLADSGVLVALGVRRGEPTVVHACADVQRLQRYAHRTEAARGMLTRVGLSHLVPQMGHLLRNANHGCLYQERLRGRELDARAPDAEALRARVRAALAPLEALHGAGRVMAGGADAPWMELLRTELGAIADWAQALEEPLAQLPSLAVRHRAPAVFVHGDYWFANLLFEPDREVVAAILDWERARPDGLAGLDALHLVAHSFAGWRGCAPLQVPVLMWLGTCEAVLDCLLDDAGTALGLDRARMQEVALVFWLSHLHQHRHERHGWSAQRREDWLVRPARAVARWLATRRAGDGSA